MKSTKTHNPTLKTRTLGIATLLLLTVPACDEANEHEAALSIDADAEAQEPTALAGPPEGPAPGGTIMEEEEPLEFRAAASSASRRTFQAPRSSRGRTVPIPRSVIINLCGDIDGCRLRMGMHNWDNSGRVASRDNLFYYNRTNHAWRAMNGDRAGKDFDGTTTHIMQAWACYFTDGNYSNWKNNGDGSLGFSLLSWNQYNADCRLTIID